MGIAVPSYGNPGFVYNEDRYNGLNEISSVGKSQQCPQEVVITCPHKNGRVCGILNGGVSLQGHAEWTEMMGGGIMSLSGSVIETGNNLLQFARGSSVQQPWMNRKMWKSTKPFSFTIPMSFVAVTNPLDDVIRPAMALLSFIYPRESNIQNAYEAIDSATKGKFSGSIDANGIAGAALRTIGLYTIPGPSIRYTGKEGGEEIGDPVSIVIGKMFAFGACYLEDVNVQFSSAMDFDGFPIAVNIEVKATVMDSGVCKTNGDFMIQEFSDTSAALGQFIDKFSESVSNTIENLKNIFDKGIGFYKDAFK